MRVLVVFVGFILGASAIFERFVSQKEWHAFRLAYGKQYKYESEELLRREIFLRNKLVIEKHNRNYEQGLATYAMAINGYSDLMPEEFARLNGAYKYSDAKLNSAEFDEAIFSIPNSCNTVIPKSIDWREKGVVTPVKDQHLGYCNSCWAFAATGALEGQHFLKTKILVSLSEQNLIDCSEYNLGCNGGHPFLALEYIKKNGGIQAEASYPYRGVNGVCNFNRTQVIATVQKAIQIRPKDETQLMKIVAAIGPVAVGIILDDRFQFYSKGIFNVSVCFSNYGNLHAVLVVGYGTDEKGMDYWLVKNSFGHNWGEEGYIRMARNMNNLCNISSLAVYPVVKKKIIVIKFQRMYAE